MPQAKLKFFGVPSLQVEQTFVTIPLKWLCMIAYLAHAGEPRSRNEVAQLLWPNAELDESRNNLRQAIHNLRVLLQKSGLANPMVVAHRTLYWQPHPDWHIDAVEWQDLIQQIEQHGLPDSSEALQAALDCIRNASDQTFMSGLEHLASPAWHDWVIERRREHQHQARQLTGPLSRNNTVHPRAWSLWVARTPAPQVLQQMQQMLPVLEWLAILGPELPLPRLQALASAEGLDSQNAIALAERIGIVRLQLEVQMPTVAFCHPDYASSLAQAIPAERQQAMHQRYLSDFIPADAACSPEMAHHAQLAGDMRTAMTHWVRAGDWAVRQGLLREARTHYLQALELSRLPLQDTRAELDILLKLGLPTQELLGYGHAESAAVYHAATRLAEDLQDPLRQCLALRGLEICSPQVAYHHCLPNRERLLALALAQPCATLQQAAHNAVADALLHLGRLPEARTHLEAAYTSYLQYPPGCQQEIDGSILPPLEDQGCLALGRLTLVHNLMGNEAAYLDTRERALALAEHTGQPESLAFILYWLSLAAFMRRDREGVLTNTERMLAITQSAGLKLYHNIALHLAGWGMGQLHMLYPDILRMDHGQAFADYPRLSPLLFLGIADDLYTHRQPRAAEAVLRALRPLISATGTYLFVPEYLRLGAACAADQGNTQAYPRREPYFTAWAQTQGRRGFAHRLSA